MDVALAVDGKGTGRFILNGTDISESVIGVQVAARAGEFTRITFEVTGDVTVIADGPEVTFEYARP